jgi:alpha-L-fucosidase
MFVDIVANGGNLLLNVGPTAEGTIPFAQAERLLALGWWLHANGDAVYGTRPWPGAAAAGTTTGAGQQVRWTARGDTVHAIVCDTPPEAVVELPVRLGAGATARLLGHEGDLRWEPIGDGDATRTRVHLPGRPAQAPALALALVGDVAPLSPEGGRPSG